MMCPGMLGRKSRGSGSCKLCKLCQREKRHCCSVGSSVPGCVPTGVIAEESPLAPAPSEVGSPPSRSLSPALVCMSILFFFFLSGELNILNKHCLTSIIYGQGFRGGDQSLRGAEGGSLSAAASLRCCLQSPGEAEGMSLGQHPENSQLGRKRSLLSVSSGWQEHL